MKNKFILPATFLLFLSVGVLLTLINIYGLFQDIRPIVIFSDEVRFENDASLSFDESKRLIKKKKGESDLNFATRLTDVISQSLSHIHWLRYENTKFNQLVPVWENYFLYLMGKLSGIPEYERYHFADSEKSLKRGIGICGDASIVMSGILKKEGIDHNIISFPGHVVTSVKLTGNKSLTYDPDFGVSIPHSIEEINNSPQLINKFYLKKGYSNYEVAVLNRAYKDDFQKWDGVEHFITNKYYFERLAYFLKWPFPLILIFISSYLLLSKRPR